MTENTELIETISSQQTSNRDKLKDVIVNLTDAMEQDYGHRFLSRFSNPESLRQYKRRLYAKLQGSEINDIVKGYELFIETRSEWPPTVPELLDYVDKAKKDRVNTLQNKAEVERLSALPPPTIECNPLEMLAKAKSVTSGQRTKEEEKRAREDALKNHNAVLNLHSHRYTRRFAQPSHYCAVPGCNKAGTISAGTNGGSNWFCAKHFRLAN